MRLLKDLVTIQHDFVSLVALMKFRLGCGSLF